MSASKNLTCKGTLRQVFIIVYRLLTGDTCSHVGIFDPALWTVAPLAFALVQLFPPPCPCVNKHTVYTYSIECVRGRLWGSGPQTDKTPAAKSIYRSILLGDILHCYEFWTSRQVNPLQEACGPAFWLVSISICSYTESINCKGAGCYILV